jgi:hypothetical protein
MSGNRLRTSRRTVAIAVTAAAIAASGVVVAVAATPPPAHLNNTVGLKTVGPILESNGFPLWYKDTSGQRLELCTDPADALCIPGALPTLGAPVVFPTNFPDEAFYSVGDSTLATNGSGGKAILVASVEAAFAGAGVPAAGQQITFGRVRIRAAGVLDGQTYKVTHPFGVDTFVADGAAGGNLAGAARGINSTQDIGSLVGGSTFEDTLASRPAPFLKWDSELGTLPQLPGGGPAYLGDPAIPHTVTGSPYNTNVFRIEGPVGSFPGSPDQCTNASLGDSNSTTDLSDCIETKLFSIQGKVATRAGVQVTKAVYANENAGHTIDLFAKSEPGQRLVITGTGISQTEMRGDGNGTYYGRVYAGGSPPADLAVTNVTDSPNIVDHVAASLFGDKVHITSAIYDNDTKRLVVVAQSGDDAATLKLEGYAAVVPVASGASETFTVEGVAVPPSDAVVTSSKGGSDDDDVVITGADFASAQVVASISTDTTSIATNQKVTLDGSGSTGTVTSFAWTQTNGPAVSFVASAPSISFTPTVAGAYSFKLVVSGTGVNNSDAANISLNVVAAAAPVANAGPDQLNMVPTSTVTLDGSDSLFASSYAWTSTNPAVVLAKADTANPTFVVPSSTTTQNLTFTLKVTAANGTTSTDTVLVSTRPDTISVDSATYKRGGTEWRVRGTANYCSANNLITITWNKPGAAGATTQVVLGTATPALAVGVCSFDYRLKSTPTAAQPGAAGTISVTSTLGGSALGQAFQLL